MTETLVLSLTVVLADIRFSSLGEYLQTVLKHVVCSSRGVLLVTRGSNLFFIPDAYVVITR